MNRKQKAKPQEKLTEEAAGPSSEQRDVKAKPQEKLTAEQAGPSSEQRDVKGQEQRQQYPALKEPRSQTIQQETRESRKQQPASGTRQPTPPSQGSRQGQGRRRDQEQMRELGPQQGRGPQKTIQQPHTTASWRQPKYSPQGAVRTPQRPQARPGFLHPRAWGTGLQPQSSPAFQRQIHSPPAAWSTGLQPQSSPASQQKIHRPPAWGTGLRPQSPPAFQRQIHSPPAAWGTGLQPQSSPASQQKIHRPPGTWQQKGAWQKKVPRGTAQQTQTPPSFRQQMDPALESTVVERREARETKQQQQASGSVQQPIDSSKVFERRGAQETKHEPQATISVQQPMDSSEEATVVERKTKQQPQATANVQQPVQPSQESEPQILEQREGAWGIVQQPQPDAGLQQLIHSPQEFEAKIVEQRGGAWDAAQQPEVGIQKRSYSPEEMEKLEEMFKQISIQQRQTGTKCKKRTTVMVNYFPLDTSKLNQAFHYDVAIKPDKPKISLPHVMEQLRMKRYPNRFPAYDGNKNLYTSKLLFGSQEMSDTVSVKVEGEMKEYKVTIKLVSKLDMRILNNSAQYAQDTWLLEPNDPTTPLQCLNVILSNVPPSSYTRVGRSFFTAPKNPVSLGEGCNLFQGFSQVATLRWKPFVNLDVANKAFTVEQPIIHLLEQMIYRVDLQRGIQQFEAVQFANYIKRLKIRYEVQNMKRTYIVNDIQEPADRATFKTEKGPMTVAEYFRNVKHQNLQYPKLPTLWVGNRSRDTKILLPMEFCTLVANQPVTRTITSNQNTNMIKATSTTATERLEKIQMSVASLQYNTNPIMKEFDLRVSNRAQEVAARILQPPDLEYQNQFRVTVQKGSWRSNKFLDPVRIVNWCILCLEPDVGERERIGFGELLISLGAESGLILSRPAYVKETLRGVRDFFKIAKYQLVVVILNKQDTCYSSVKRASELSNACLTQCVKGNRFRGGIKRATVANILLKINAKLNGQNHRIIQMPQFVKNSTMIMGADVTHPGSQNFPSIAAVTASFDESFFKYRFEWRLQPPRQEMITDLKDITEKHLQFYERERHSKPGQIIYIRDGVSDGEFKEVLNVELKAIREACRGTYNPQICIILVQKRHRTRFFPKDPRISEDRNGNVPAGTCVDTLITHSTIPDFFLVSHASIKGVARPTKYIKIWDELKMPEDEVEELMYYLCHLYARCNRSVSYPAPTYYAHHAAARAKAYCDRNIDIDRLKDTQSRLQIQPDILNNTPMFFI